jgi:hypothetical protein
VRSRFFGISGCERRLSAEKPAGGLPIAMAESGEASAEARKRIANRMKELQPAAQNTAIARTSGVNESTARRDTSANAEPASKNNSKNSAHVRVPSANAEPISGAKAAALIEPKEKTEARRTERKKEDSIPEGFPDAAQRRKLMLSRRSRRKVAATSEQS